MDYIITIITIAFFISVFLSIKNVQEEKAKRFKEFEDEWWQWKKNNFCVVCGDPNDNDKNICDKCETIIDLDKKNV